MRQRESGRHRHVGTSDIWDSSENLRPVTGRPSLPKYLRQLWLRRHFIRAEAHAKAFSISRNMILGHLWLIIGPILDIAVYGLIFGLVLKTSRGVDAFVPYLVVGVVLFRMLSRDINSGCDLIRHRRNMIKAFPFPRAALVCSYSLKSCYDAIPPTVVLLVFIAFYPDGSGLTWKWILFPLVFILHRLLSMGFVFFAAWSTHIIPDLSKVIQFSTRFLFYVSCVFFSIDRYEDHPLLHSITEANPAYQVLSISRDLLIYDSLPEVSSWIILGMWTICTLLVSFILFWSREVSYGKF